MPTSVKYVHNQPSFNSLKFNVLILLKVKLTLDELFFRSSPGASGGSSYEKRYYSLRKLKYEKKTFKTYCKLTCLTPPGSITQLWRLKSSIS